LDSEFPRFGCPGVVFLFIEFPLRQQISCLFYFPHLRYFVAHEHTLGCLEVIFYFQLVLELGTLCLRFISWVWSFRLLFFIMSQFLHCIPAFDGTNYGYWIARMCFFLKSIDVWWIAKIGWIKPEATTAELFVAQTSARLSNDKVLHALCKALSPSEFEKLKLTSNINNCVCVHKVLTKQYQCGI
jgi:hypothetical protein